MNQKQGNKSAVESSVGSAVTLLIIWALSFTPYKMDAITAGALAFLLAAASSKIFGDRRK